MDWTDANNVERKVTWAGTVKRIQSGCYEMKRRAFLVDILPVAEFRVAMFLQA